MQTRFSVRALADPDLRHMEQILRKCVHCGFCNATCPTYALTGNELDGPRGRIYLIKEMLEQETEPGAAVTRHLDRCLSCFACKTTCPSGVDYMHLSDFARQYIETRQPRLLSHRVLRGLLGYLLPEPRRLRPWVAAATAFNRVIRLPGAVGRMQGLLRDARAREAGPRPGYYPAAATGRGRVALLPGCVQQVLAGDINAATVRVLNRLGFGVDVLDSPCCGAINHHLGQAPRALQRLRGNVRQWRRQPAWSTLLVNASGCGTMIKDYRHLLRNDAELASAAADISTSCRDISEFLLELAAPSPRIDVAGLRVACQVPCSMRNGQRIGDAPARLLQRWGFKVDMAPDDETCCGSAGTYNLLQPRMAELLGQRKADAVDAAGIDVVASGNLGCMLQMSRFSSVPFLHTVQLLDWVSGGARPAGLSQPADQH